MLGNSSFSADVRTDECAGTAMFPSDGRVYDSYEHDSLKPEQKVPDHWKTVKVQSLRLDELVGRSQRIALWHIDTEARRHAR